MKTLLIFLTGLGLAISSLALAMTIGYDVKVQNMRSVPAKVEITQYHSEGFNGTPPKRFTQDLKIWSKVLVLQPGESQLIHYTSASGGFWLVWKMLDSPTDASGVIHLVEGENVINLK